MPGPPPPGPITLVTWNAQGSRRPDAASAAAALAELDADVVLLQEVTHRLWRELRRELGAADGRWCFKHWGVKVPPEGLGVLTRLPLLGSDVQVLAHPVAVWNWRRRVALHVTVDQAGRALGMVTVHLGAGVTGEERVRQAEVLLGRSRDAVLIAGDLNAGPESRELAVFGRRGWWDAERRLHHDRPAPSTNWPPGPRTVPPSQRLDYLMVRDDAEVLDARIPDDSRRWAALSDHLPVVARVRYPD